MEEELYFESCNDEVEVDPPDLPQLPLVEEDFSLLPPPHPGLPLASSEAAFQDVQLWM